MGITTVRPQLMSLIELRNSIINFFSNFSPSPGFLSDIAAFEAAILALAIPLSFEIISRASERYQSDVISRRFVKGWIISLMPYILLLNIVIAIAVRFFVNDNSVSQLWKIFSFISLVGFIIVAILFMFVLKRLILYMSDSDLILRELFEEAERLLE